MGIREKWDPDRRIGGFREKTEMNVLDKSSTLKNGVQWGIDWGINIDTMYYWGTLLPAVSTNASWTSFHSFIQYAIYARCCFAEAFRWFLETRLLSFRATGQLVKPCVRSTQSFCVSCVISSDPSENRLLLVHWGASHSRTIRKSTLFPRNLTTTSTTFPVTLNRVKLNL